MKPMLGWILAAIAVAGAGGGYWMKGHAAAPADTAAPAEPVAQVSTELAKERVLIDALSAVGEVSPGQLAGLSFARAGQVTQLNALPGDRVTKGSLLATLALDPAARETYLQATNALGLARREAERLRQLLALQLATRSQVDAAEKAELDAAGAVKALDAQGGGATSSTITAPFDGVVSSVPVAQGDRVAAGAAILQLAHADALRVQIGVEPAQSRRVRAGTKVTLTPVSLPDENALAIEATVASVQDIVDPKTQLVSAIVNLPRSAGPLLVPGMKVRARLQVGTLSALAVPRNAVLTDAGGDCVYQVVGGKARRVTVTKRLEADGFVAITGLTDPKLPVVTVGNYVLRDGMAVRQVAANGAAS